MINQRNRITREVTAVQLEQMIAELTAMAEGECDEVQLLVDDVFEPTIVIRMSE